ncbi:MAG: PIN domain-containing protein [Candidatus Symbiothrix sp.]|jgi:tRNA(fMet)-specific endonuclease VapC|nr:PIN domain-containing protein [Candidatus Symbiothrix sp.]
MKYLLDTNICAFHLRGKLNLAGRKHCYISEITVFELRFGAENSDNPEKHHKLVNTLLKGLTILPIIGCVDIYAKEKVRLRKLGKPLNDDFDLLIGATAIKNGLTLVTDNIKDFERLENIEIENWMSR